MPGKYAKQRSEQDLHSTAGDEARTRNIQLGRLMLYQLSYARKSPIGKDLCPSNRSASMALCRPWGLVPAMDHYMIPFRIVQASFPAGRAIPAGRSPLPAGIQDRLPPAHVGGPADAADLGCSRVRVAGPRRWIHVVGSQQVGYMWSDHRGGYMTPPPRLPVTGGEYKPRFAGR